MRAQSPLYLIAKSSGSRDLCSVKVAMSRALAPLHLSFCYIFLPSASKLCTAVGCEVCEYRGESGIGRKNVCVLSETKRKM